MFVYNKMVHNMYSEDEESQEEYINYKQKYRALKKNLRYLIYENECFQDELRKAQRNFVSISRDKSFLLDRILKYEKPQGQSSDSEITESSDEDEERLTLSTPTLSQRKKITKRKRSEAEFHNGSINESHSMIAKQMTSKPSAGKPTTMKVAIPVKKPKKQAAPRKPTVKKDRDNITIKENDMSIIQPEAVVKGYRINSIPMSDDQVATAEAVNSLSEYEHVDYEFTTITSGGQMTREEVERHLESRRFSPELNTTATVPAELFSQEPDHESDFEGSEICEFIQLEEDATSADMVLE